MVGEKSKGEKEILDEKSKGEGPKEARGSMIASKGGIGWTSEKETH